MENKELFGLGKTWWVALLVIAGTFVMIGMGIMPVEELWKVLGVIYGPAAIKSAAVGFAAKKQPSFHEEPDTKG